MSALGSLLYTYAPARLLHRMSTMLGEPVVGFVAVAITKSGRIHGMCPPGQNPCITADLAADLAESLGVHDVHRLGA